MLRIALSQIAVSLFLGGSAASAHTFVQQTPDDYQKLVTQAQGETKERKFDAAVDHWQKAYELQPNLWLLAEMGKAYLALGKTAEAEKAFSKVLDDGGEISFDFLHRHNFGQCYGSLVISKQKFRWIGAGKGDSYHIVPSELEDLQPISQYVSTWHVRGIAMPLFKVRAAKKNWLYEYLLYGKGKYKSETEGWTDKTVVYLDAELAKAEEATELILRMLSKLSGAGLQERRIR